MVGIEIAAPVAAGNCTPAWSGLVLAGGTSRRLGGVDKTQLSVGGKPVLDWVLEALAAADELIVVGPRLATARPVRFAQEDPPGSGPMNAIRAGLRLVTTELVLVVAGDQVGLRADTVARLQAVGDNVVLTDAADQAQLCGWFNRLALQAALDHPDLMSWRRLVELVAPQRLVGNAREVRDVDTQQDLDWWRERDRLS